MESRFDLRRYLRRNRLAAKRVRSFSPPFLLERRFERVVRRLIREWSVVLNESIIPQYARARRILVEEDEIGVLFGGQAAINRVNRELEKAAARTAEFARRLHPSLEAAAIELADWHRKRFIASIKEASKVNVEPFLSLRETQTILSQYVQRNVALIKGLDAELAKKVEVAVIDSMNSRYAVSRLRKRLVDDLGFASGRARIIARDQVMKYTTSLDRFRMEQLGIDKFVWVYTWRSKEPRQHHIARDGTVYAWNSLPEDGAPGDAIGCQCRAQAHLEQ